MGKRSKRHKQARHRQLIRGRVGSQTTADIVGRRGERMLPIEEGPGHTTISAKNAHGNNVLLLQMFL
jgi:hypothetical protein